MGAMERGVVLEAAALIERERDLQKALRVFRTTNLLMGRPWLLVASKQFVFPVIECQVDGLFLQETLQKDLDRTQQRLRQLGVTPAVLP